MSHSIIPAITDSVRLDGILTNTLNINGEGEAHRDGKDGRRLDVLRVDHLFQLFELEYQPLSQARERLRRKAAQKIRILSESLRCPRVCH